MRDYLLFIDTEASGLPKNWKAPFSEEGNWPYAVQVSWIIYTKAGEEVKRENYYISNNDFEITPAALAIHGITAAYRRQHGEDRRKILSFLADDLHQYQPLVIGHFMEFDALVLGAEFYRTGRENPITGLPLFCTMLVTKNYIRNPLHKYLHLGDLYYLLFNDPLQQQHNALADARATAKCFFEMVKRGDITEKKVQQQQLKIDNSDADTKKLGYSLLAVFIFLLTLILYYWL